MSSIGSVGMSSMNNMQRPDPLGIFKKTDSDGSGGVSQAELKNLADVIKEKTGKTLEVSDKSFKTYDSNSDGSLSGDELKSVLDNSGFGPPQGMQGMGPPPPPPQQASNSYNANSSNSGQDSVSELVSNLQNLLGQLTGTSGQNNPHGMQGPPPGGGQQGAPPPPPPNGGGSMSSNSTSTSQIFDTMDTNKDGTVSAEELLAARGGESGSGKSSSTNTSASFQDQIKELNSLLKTLSKYVDSKSTESGSLVSITS
jgi:Ca2+-binding EF-hand superfamily protein